jgi:hypothetical protein
MTRAWLVVLAGLAACHPPVPPQTCSDANDADYVVRWAGAPLHVEVHHGPRIASVLVANGDHLYVLHASAQLGTAIYVKTAPGPSGVPRWALRQPFQFECRFASTDKVHGPDCLDYIKWHDGWIANVSEHGVDRVFDISKRVAPRGARFAVVSFDPTSGGDLPDLRACRGVTGDALSPTLQAGNTPPTIEVDPSEWPVVQ